MVIVIFEKESNRFLSLFPQFSQIEDNTDTCVLSLFHWPFQLKKSRLNKNQSLETIIVKTNKLMFLLID